VSFEVIAGPDGRHLVLDHGRRYVVPADLGARLSGPDGHQHWRRLLPRPAERSSSGLLLWLRFTVLPAPVVRALSRPLRHLTGAPLLLGMAALGLAGAACAPPPVPVAAADLALAMALFLLGGLWHELGHAAALCREGWAPGAVGGGLLILWPVMWSDVSCIGLLPRRGRVRVDVAGVCFQLGFVGLAGLASLAWPPGALVVRAGLLAVAWSLLPVVRSDGHWLACDLLGLEGLAQAPPADLGRRGHLLLAGWRVATLVAMGGILAGASWRLLAFLARVDLPAGPWRVVAGMLLAAVLMAAAWRVGRRAAGLVRALARDGLLGP
jgi:hypothetical protein